MYHINRATVSFVMNLHPDFFVAFAAGCIAASLGFAAGVFATRILDYFS